MHIIVRGEVQAANKVVLLANPDYQIPDNMQVKRQVIYVAEE
jgi:hypothetical protein